MELKKTKAHRTKKEVEGLSKEEQQRWAGNGKSDELAKAAVEWHVTPADESESRAKQTLWRCRVVQSIGNFLAVLPNAHVLYADHQEDEGAAEMDVVGINREHEQEEEDVFGFGLSIENLGEGPEGHEQSGLMDVGDWQANKTLQPEKGHAWLWNGSTWQCQHCLRIRKRGRSALVSAAASHLV